MLSRCEASRRLVGYFWCSPCRSASFSATWDSPVFESQRERSNSLKRLGVTAPTGDVGRAVKSINLALPVSGSKVFEDIEEDSVEGMSQNTTCINMLNLGALKLKAE